MELKNQVEIENKAIAKQLMEDLWNKGDRSLLDKVISPDVHFHGPSMELKNRTEYNNLVDGYLSAFKDTHITAEHLVAEDDMVAYRFVFEGVHAEKMADVPPKGKKIKLTGLVMQRFEDGMIVEEWEEFDQLGMMKQLGMELIPMEMAH